MLDISLSKIQLGEWSFNKINLEDMDMYSKYISETDYIVNLWSANFPYIWTASQSNLRQILWKIIDDMLVTFALSYKGSLYLYCLPFGRGVAENVTETLFKCLKYCYKWNNNESSRTMVRIINQSQLDFLRNCNKFDKYFRLVTLKGIERHYSLKNLVNLEGKDFGTLRNKINRFRRENPEAVFRKFNKDEFDKLIELGNRWKNTLGEKYASVFDGVYYKEIIKHSAELNQIIMVIEKGGKILGMVSGGELPTGQGWGSLIKFNEGFVGLPETLSVEFARELARLYPAMEFLNVGSDLGVKGLRDYKLKFRPVLNYKRYRIYLK